MLSSQRAFICGPCSHLCAARSDMSTFFEDIKVARPTSMMIIPRIANMLFDQAQEQLRKAKDENKQVCSQPLHITSTERNVMELSSASSPESTRAWQ